MPNDISGVNSGRSQQSNDRQVSPIRKEKSQQGGANPASTGPTDTVSLTDMASRLKALEQKLSEQPDVDQSRVDRVRDAISNGQYNINPERVADKMMDFEADF